MQRTEIVLTAIEKLGVKQVPLTRVYRQLYNPDLYLSAYGKLYRNQGAMTKGHNDEGIDGMSLERIQKVIDQMKEQRYIFKPARRIYVSKGNGRQRPIGIPGWEDKLVQEVIRILLEAYYEPSFSQSSHGFRPLRGCHTALIQVKKQFKGAAWFIEGDMRSCFDEINHEVLLSILSRKIQDGRLLELIRRWLKAGYMEDWRYNQTHSGTPQGGILSPLMANIYLNEFDQYLETTILPKWNRGKARQSNREYQRLSNRAYRARRKGNITLAQELSKQMRNLPTQDVNDPNYRRLKYVRYADDFILSFIGSKKEAEAIKQEIRDYLRQTLKLELSDEKTLITHAKTEQAQFLGYEIQIHLANNKVNRMSKTERRRCINGQVRLGIPFGLVTRKCREYMEGGKPERNPRVLHLSVPEIMKDYDTKYRGLVNYYQYAEDMYRLNHLKGVMTESLVKTLSNKLKISCRTVYRRYSQKRVVDGRTYQCLYYQLKANGKSYEFWWGGIPLQCVKIDQKDTPELQDSIVGQTWNYRNELTRRLEADQCELCGSRENIQVHHIRKLKDLKKKWQNRKKKPPQWVERMISINRKTLVVCKRCHQNIHDGTINTQLT